MLGKCCYSSLKVHLLMKMLNRYFPGVCRSTRYICVVCSKNCKIRDMHIGTHANNINVRLYLRDNRILSWLATDDVIKKLVDFQALLCYNFDLDTEPHHNLAKGSSIENNNDNMAPIQCHLDSSLVFEMYVEMKIGYSEVNEFIRVPEDLHDLVLRDDGSTCTYLKVNGCPLLKFQNLDKNLIQLYFF